MTKREKLLYDALVTDRAYLMVRDELAKVKELLRDMTLMRDNANEIWKEYLGKLTAVTAERDNYEKSNRQLHADCVSRLGFIDQIADIIGETQDASPREIVDGVATLKAALEIAENEKAHCGELLQQAQDCLKMVMAERDNLCKEAIEREQEISTLRRFHACFDNGFAAQALGGATYDAWLAALVEADPEIVLGDKWTGKIVVLPTGERVLLTRLSFNDGHGWKESTAAVLLPPLKAEKP